jgi:hypothetical protein
VKRPYAAPSTTKQFRGAVKSSAPQARRGGVETLVVMVSRDRRGHT